MIKLNKLDEKALMDALTEWFNQTQAERIINKRFWNRNKIAKLIKIQLKSINKWKNGRRGKPDINNIKSNKIDNNGADW